MVGFVYSIYFNLQEFWSKKNLFPANSSPKIYPPSLAPTIDCLSLKEQHELKGAAWYQAGIPREISLEVLTRQNPGAFLVRQSSTKPGCFALSLRVPPPAPKVAHYLILRTVRGYKIKVSFPLFVWINTEIKLLSLHRVLRRSSLR